MTTLRALAGAAALWLGAIAAAQAATTWRYTITTQDKVSGHMVVESPAAGEFLVDYSYRNNGRGPDMKESFGVDALGAPRRYQVEGKSTFGGEIRESFEQADGTARWSSLVDRGDKPVPASALYLPVEFTDALTAQIVRSLLRRPDGKGAAVAGATLAVERLAELRVAGADGELPVALYALTGADSFPWMIWLRDDDEQALFAVVWPGYELIAEGYEPQAAALLARQRQAQAERLQALQKRLAKPLPGLTVIRGVRWFDARAARMRGPSDVHLFDGRIAAVWPSGSTPAQRARPDASIDGSGRTLLPGLFDMHGHVWTEQGLMHLAAGVTSVRDLANDNKVLFDLVRRWDSGLEAGPRVSINGFIEGRSPFSALNGIVAENLDEALAAVDWYAARGFRQLKLYNSIRPEWVEPIAARAHARGLRVGGHVPAFMRAEQAVRAGYDELHHINQVMLNFLVGPKDDTRTLLRFYRVGEKANEVALDAPKMRAFIGLLRERGTVVDPTAGIFETMFTQRNGAMSPAFAPVFEHLPVVQRRNLLSNSMDVNDANAARFAASWQRLLGMIGAMHRAGVPLVAGTDGWAGFGLHRELELYVQAGIPALQVLKIATWNGARFSGMLERTGSIEAGKLADLVLIDGDPSRRISDIRRPVLVVKGGVAYAPAQIHEALGVKPFVDAAAIEPAAASAPAH